MVSPRTTSLARARSLGEPCVARTRGQAFEGRVVAETEIRGAGGADRPAAPFLVQREQRAAVSIMDRFVDRRLRLAIHCLEHLILQPWHRSWPRSRAAFPRSILSRRASCIAIFFSRQVETGEFADDGVAAHPDVVGDLAAGQPGFKAVFQAFDAFGSPGGFGHVDGPKLWSSRGPNRRAQKGSLQGVLPLSRIASSPSLMASRMPSSIRVLATPGTLVPWVPCRTSFSR